MYSQLANDIFPSVVNTGAVNPDYTPKNYSQFALPCIIDLNVLTELIPSIIRSASPTQIN